MKKRNKLEGRGRLLEAWESPPENGEPVGCLATTYTFQAGFFEEQCLSRFLGMETDPIEDGAAYLIEREERLAETYACVLIDRRQAGAERSLRWDALPIHVHGAAMHAKIALLVWSRHVRLIIGSANLTEVAYRENLEVYGVLDFRDGGEAPIQRLREAIGFLEDLLTHAPEGPARERAAGFLQNVRRNVRNWRERRSRRGELRVALVFGGRLNGKVYSAIEALRNQIWPGANPPRTAMVTSPFFDEDATTAARALEAALAKRGACDISFDLATDLESDGRLRVSAPDSLRRTLPEAAFYAIKLREGDQVRALHAKALWLENDRFAVYMLGSSNFTRAGLGLGKGPRNIEANIAFVSSDEKSYLTLKCAYSFGDELIDPDQAIWQRAVDVDSEDPILPELPTAFADATFAPAGNGAEGGKLTLTVTGSAPSRWSVWKIGVPEKVYDNDDWAAGGRAELSIVDWDGTLPPSALRVRWSDKRRIERQALWPVNVSEPTALPPPDELRGLSLETLLQVLTMAGPLHEAVKRATERIKHQTPQLLDPLHRFSTETFLLQRTRRFARALEQLRQRLERPLRSKDALAWRLRGPVGPLTLMRALLRENPKRPESELAFLLAEIGLTLSRVRPSRLSGIVATRFVKQELDQIVREIKNEALPHLDGTAQGMRAYVKRAFQEALK